MAKTKISEYSSTSAGANLNTDINTIDIDEGCAPSGINNAIRTLMAQLKDFQTGVSGDGLTLGGALSGTSATFSGNVTASAISGASLTLSGNITASAISGASLTLSGNVTASAISGASMTLSGDLTVDTNTLYVDSTNNEVGIGTSSPDAKLHIHGGDQTTANIDTSSNIVLNVAGTGASVNNGGSVVFSAADGAWKFAAIKGLAVDGANNSAGDLAFSVRKATTDSTLSEAMRIKSSGRLGIGTTSPAVKFQVSGYVTSGGQNYSARFSDAVNSTFSIGHQSGLTNLITDTAMAFYTSNTERMRITSTGNVGIGTSSPSQKLDVVGNIEVSGGIYLGGTVAANLLDDYEEGTWTPVINPISGTVTSSTVSGKYIKVGNLVTASFSAEVTGGTISSVSSISGLPFVSSGSSIGASRENTATGLMWQLLLGNGGTAVNMWTYHNQSTAASGYTWIGSITYITA